VSPGVSARTFVVTVSESPARVVIEDIRSGDRRALADGLNDVGREIARLLSQTPRDDALAPDAASEHA
jgi:hypothetical protein